MRTKVFMKKAFTAIAAISLTAVNIMPMNVMAEANSSYEVTYRPGKLGAFTEAFAQECREAAQNVEVTKLGAIKMEVSAGSTVPFPAADSVVLTQENQGRYLVNAEYPEDVWQTWSETQSGVKGNLNYVVDYVAVVDAVEYSVNFVDAESGESIATPVILQGNVGQTVNYQPKTIANYELVEVPSPITLTDDADANTLVFRYNYTVEPTVQTTVVPGTTTYETLTTPGTVTTTTVTAPAAGAGAAAGGAAAGAGAAGAGAAAGGAGAGAAAGEAAPAAGEEGLTAVGEEQTPLANINAEGADASGSGDEMQVLSDEETPLANLNVESENTNDRGMLYAGIFAAILALAGAGYYGYKKVKAKK